MKDFSWKIFAIKTIIFSIWGLSTLPFLSIIVQYIDSITGFSSGNGYHTNHMDYIFESPLVYMGVVFCINSKRSIGGTLVDLPIFLDN